MRIGYRHLADLDVHLLFGVVVPVGIFNSEAGYQRLMITVSGIGIKRTGIGSKGKRHVGVVIARNKPYGFSRPELCGKEKDINIFHII
jgi:hypothetical protein